VISHPLVREPQQARSRRSLDRALDAALQLLVERGTPSFTLAEVARAAGVSTGSIYGRVASKDDLIRALHAREMARLDAETRRVFAALHEDATATRRDTSAPTHGVDERAVRRAVATLAGLLQSHARVLSPFLLLGLRDEVIAREGKISHAQMTQLFEQAVAGAYRDGDGLEPSQAAAVAWAGAVVWSVLARQLALGSDPQAAADLHLDEVVTRLARMVAAYLREPDGPTRPD
jgi:AcrR family transcriptional regulator